MDEYLEPMEWKEIYYLTFPEMKNYRSKKDRSFSSVDLIRFFENNLTDFEQYEVVEYFERYCVRDEIPEIEPLPVLPDLIPPPLPLPPVLPVLILPPPPPPALPPPDPVVPLSLPPGLIDVFPFVIPHLLIPGIKNLLKEYFGVPELQAAVTDFESQAKKWEWMYKDSLNDNVKGSIGGPRFLERKYTAALEEIDRMQALLSHYEALLSQNETQLPQNETRVPEWYDDFEWPGDETWEETDDWWDENDEYEDDDLIREEDYPPSSGGTEGTIPSTMEKIAFYYVEEQLEKECDRLKLEYEWKYWVVIQGTTWYMFEIDGDLYEFTVDEARDFLVELKKLSTPDEMDI